MYTNGAARTGRGRGAGAARRVLMFIARQRNSGRVLCGSDVPIRFGIDIEFCLLLFAYLNISSCMFLIMLKGNLKNYTNYTASMHQIYNSKSNVALGSLQLLFKFQ